MTKQGSHGWLKHSTLALVFLLESSKVLIPLSLSQLFSQESLSLLLGLNLCFFSLLFADLLLLSANSLLMFSSLLGLLFGFSLLVFLHFTLNSLLSRFLLKRKDESFSGNLLAFLAFPFLTRHFFKVCTEEMVWFFTVAASDEFARVFAMETIIRILNIK